MKSTRMCDLLSVHLTTEACGLEDISACHSEAGLIMPVAEYTMPDNEFGCSPAVASNLSGGCEEGRPVNTTDLRMIGPLTRWYLHFDAL